MQRRRFLQAAGCTLALPALETFGADKIFNAGTKPKRLFILTSAYGVYLPHFYPDKTGRDFEFKECARSLEPLRNDLTILGNLTHAPALHGHLNQDKILCGSEKLPTFGDSLDQFAAKRMSNDVPFDCLTMKADYKPTAGTSVRDRVPVTQFYNPEEIFSQFFGKKNVDKRVAAINRDRSVLDICRQQAKALQKRVSASDNARLQEYFHTIRETETFLQKNVDWISKPAPDTGYTKDDFHHEYSGGMFPRNFDMYYESLLRCAHLAFKYDLTRVAHLRLVFVGPNHHGATHHSGRESSINSLKRFDGNLLDKFAGLLAAFKETKMPEGGTLMDQTVSLYTASLGNASAHRGSDIPAIVAGGAFQHGSHIRYEQPQDISDLYLTLLRHVGVEADSFISGTHTLEL